VNIHRSAMEADLDGATVADLLDRIRAWAETASGAERARLDPALRAALAGLQGDTAALASEYDAAFRVDADYRESLPDLQNGPASLIRGARRPIQHVGVSGFRVPVRYLRRGGGEWLLETHVTGTVGLGAEAKGINMSRLMRGFYETVEESTSFEVMDRALDAYGDRLGGDGARLAMRLSYPMRVQSLRSGLSGWQYYDVAMEAVRRAGGAPLRVLHLDYVYSSTCPCSLELSEHARGVRGRLATPHSQRSVARLSVVLEEGEGTLWIEDLVEICRRQVPTETQVMVKREDEQAFAELNGANPIFVEDAARLFAEGLAADPRIGDYRALVSHQESLHSHDAVSVLTEGDTFAAESLDPRVFASLRHPG
jgi:GTP cyclohydrolase IB